MTKLKLMYISRYIYIVSSWNEKPLDDEIETSLFLAPRSLRKPEMKSISMTRLKRDWRRFTRTSGQTWNEKHLDDEIETSKNSPVRANRTGYPEMKSISITRLKPIRLRGCRRLLLPWNEKPLDYEIETRILRHRLNALRKPTWNEKPLDDEIETLLCRSYSPIISDAPEMKSISITRLKLQRHRISLIYREFAWNEKPLDYEIETSRHWTGPASQTDSWNEKHLDYEIETTVSRRRLHRDIRLKWKASRLRDWNTSNAASANFNSTVLKWKASRLRDWNSSSRSSSVT